MRRLLVPAVTVAVALGFAATASAANYIVVDKQQGTPASVALDVAAAGGTLVAAYDQIGVAIARSDSASFAGHCARTAASTASPRPRASRQS